MRPIILYANENHEVIIKKDELNRLFQQIYEEGYEDGKKAPPVDYTPWYPSNVSCDYPANHPHAVTYEENPLLKVVTADSSMSSTPSKKFVKAYNNTIKE